MSKELTLREQFKKAKEWQESYWHASKLMMVMFGFAAVARIFDFAGDDERRVESMMGQRLQAEAQAAGWKDGSIVDLGKIRKEVEAEAAISNANRGTAIYWVLGGTAALAGAGTFASRRQGKIAAELDKRIHGPAPV